MHFYSIVFESYQLNFAHLHQNNTVHIFGLGAPVHFHDRRKNGHLLHGNLQLVLFPIPLGQKMRAKMLKHKLSIFPHINNLLFSQIVKIITFGHILFFLFVFILHSFFLHLCPIFIGNIDIIGIFIEIGNILTLILRLRESL